MFLGVVVIIAIFPSVFKPLWEAFQQNTLFNGMIIGVMVFGVGYVFRQVMMLYPEVAWIESFRRDQMSISTHAPPRLLGAMATMLGDRPGGRLRLSALSLRSLLDSISARLDESRELTRYVIGLLIFLGLLGTFWGLLKTIHSVGGVIAGLDVSAADLGTFFSDLKQGLEAPLSGMGTAFSSSLFGLGGSLVVGFLELQASQAQNRFYNELEEWLSSLTRLSSGTSFGEGDQPVPAYIEALLEQTADSLENLQRTLARGEESQLVANTHLTSLTERLGTLTDQMRAEQSLMVKLAEHQLELKPILASLAEASSQGSIGMDNTTRTHIRNIDIHLSRLLEDISSGRHQMVQELRSEIKLLARTIAALSEEEGR